ncbi:hypothetical protein ScPMuIL_009316 [Solemya velum]
MNNNRTWLIPGVTFLSNLVGQAGYGTPYGTYPQGGPPPGAGYLQGGPPLGAAYPQGGPPPGAAYPQGGPPPGAGYPQGGPPLGAAYPQGGAYQQGALPPGTYPQGGPPPAGSYQGGAPYQGTPYQGPPQGGGPPQTQFTGEMPDDDVDDDPNAQAPPPSAPPMEKMDTVTGYSNIGFQSGGMLPPPSYEEAMKGPAPERGEISNVPTITEKEARESLLHFVAENCCYGKGAAEELTFQDLKSSSAFHYKLETFAEGRQTCWANEPFRGQQLDGPFNGPAPGPWEIQMQPQTMFTDSKVAVEVPHTASAKPCHECLALGRVRCYRCHGRGRVRCTPCLGSGHVTRYRQGEHERVNCTFCHGRGRRQCYTCHGNGMVTCTTCQGTTQLKWYIKLTVQWTNHIIDHIVERTTLPDHLIRNVTGQVAFEESQLRVWPVNHFPDAEINNASQRLVNQHSTAFPSEKILMQRHNVRIIPVTQAMYRWKDKDSSYFVFGFENKVHAPDYPQKCCWGCVLL